MMPLLLGAQLGWLPVWAWLAATIAPSVPAVAVAYFSLQKVRARAAAEVEKVWISEMHQTARFQIAATAATASPMAEIVHELGSGGHRPEGDIDQDVGR